MKKYYVLHAASPVTGEWLETGITMSQYTLDRDLHIRAKTLGYSEYRWVMTPYGTEIQAKLLQAEISQDLKDDLAAYPSFTNKLFASVAQDLERIFKLDKE